MIKKLLFSIAASIFLVLSACNRVIAQTSDRVQGTSSNLDVVADNDDAAVEETSVSSVRSVNRNKPGNVYNGDSNFDYFMTSGYAANDIQNIPAVGQVDGTPELDGSLSVAKSVYVSLNDDKTKLQPGTKLIVYGDEGDLVLKEADFDKRFIKNLAVLSVREQAGKKRYLADVVTSYDFFNSGDPVKFYDGERALWDKAKAPKPPSANPIKCYVVGGERGREMWNQEDYVILTAGSKQGVVEGISFQLLELSYGPEGKRERKSRGWAKVFYAGTSYCLARILDGSDSISSGFEAVYKP